MKKRELAALAMLGISAGLMVGGCQNKEGDRPSEGHVSSAVQTTAAMDFFFSKLSLEAQEQFNQLDELHKMMAIEMAHLSTEMGGSSTTVHGCAGKNACKGQGGAPIRDPNKAVETQYNNQLNQRRQTTQEMGNTTSHEKTHK